MRREIELDSIAATEALARAIAPRLVAGDMLALSGPLGAGKSLFARALIRARLGSEIEVPSPSYTLVQIYGLDGAELWHADLYRLGEPSELAELGLEDAFRTAVTLVEWPERLGPLLPARRLAITLAFVPGRDEARGASLAAEGPGWAHLGPVLEAPGAAA